MTDLSTAGSYVLGDRNVHRMGYGAMQLPGPGVFGPPRNHAAAIAVLREAIAAGVNHIDTSDFYGPHVANHLIREALAPYSDGLVLVTKLGARRDDNANWLPAVSPSDLRAGLEDNLRHLGLEAMEVVNMRFRGDAEGHGAAEGPVAPQVRVLAEMQREGLIRHIGLSNVTAAQIAEARAICPIVCIQNQYNIAFRNDDPLIDALAEDGIAYVPFFPLGGFTPLQSDQLHSVADRLAATPMQVALAWLLQRSPNILLIPGTSSIDHLRENLAAASLKLDSEALAVLNGIGAKHE